MPKAAMSNRNLHLIDDEALSDDELPKPSSRRGSRPASNYRQTSMERAQDYSDIEYDEQVDAKARGGQGPRCNRRRGAKYCLSISCVVLLALGGVFYFVIWPALSTGGSTGGGPAILVPTPPGEPSCASVGIVDVMVNWTESTSETSPVLKYEVQHNDRLGWLPFQESCPEVGNLSRYCAVPGEPSTCCVPVAGHQTPREFAFSSLAANSSYAFRVRAWNSDPTGALQASNWSVTGRCVTKLAHNPDAPSPVYLTNSSSTSLDVAWRPPAHTHGSVVTGYTLEMQRDLLPLWKRVTSCAKGPRATGCAVGGLTSGTPVRFRVRALTAEYKNSGSNFSRPVVLRPDAAGAHPPTPPNRPRVETPSPVSVAVSWEAIPAAGDGGAQVLGYDVTLLTYAPPPLRTASAAAGAAGTAGAGIGADEAAVDTIELQRRRLGTSASAWYGCYGPFVPASAAGAGAVAAAGGAADQHGGGGGGGGGVQLVHPYGSVPAYSFSARLLGAANTSWSSRGTAAKLLPATAYSVTVRAFNSRGDSAPGPAATTITPGGSPADPPTGIEVVQTTGGSLKLVWTAPGEPAKHGSRVTGFEVQRDDFWVDRALAGGHTYQVNQYVPLALPSPPPVPTRALHGSPARAYPVLSVRLCARLCAPLCSSAPLGTALCCSVRTALPLPRPGMPPATPSRTCSLPPSTTSACAPSAPWAPATGARHSRAQRRTRARAGTLTTCWCTRAPRTRCRPTSSTAW
jgi:hypothetical protein